MPAKSSPEAAQRKVWKSEIKTHEKAARQIKTQFRNEQKKLISESLAAHRAVVKFQQRAEKQMPKLLGNIDTRIAILKGRLGL
jgi:vacuolar-type H+-ATPase subunit H